MRSIPALVILLLSSYAAAQAPALAKPYKVDLPWEQVHLITPSEAIHAEDEPIPAGLTPIQRAIAASKAGRIYGGMVNVSLEVIVNQKGRVESAKPTNGPQKFYDQAVAIEQRRAFRPIRNGAGEVVRATFTDYVSVYPPERWLDSAPSLPTNVDMGTVSISLARTSCFGSCPAYTVTIDGDGKIYFDGGFSVAVPGHHQAQIFPQAVRELLDRFRQAKFLSARDEYTSNWTDNPTQTLTLSVNGIHKQVVDYIGLIVGLPEAIKDLEAEVDRTAETARWVTGNTDTMSSLRAERWNFASASKENLDLYNAAIERDNKPLLQAFLDAKTPIITSVPKLAQPICVATKQGNRDLVEDMLAHAEQGPPIPAPVKNVCLAEAAHAGNLALVDIWLSKGASAKSTPAAPYAQGDDDAQPGIFPLLDAVTSNNPDVVDRLLHAHASVATADNNNFALVSFALRRFDSDQSSEAVERLRRTVTLLLQANAPVNDQTENDRPALFEASTAPDLIPQLLAAGANVNMRDENGETPLMYASNDDTVKALLAVGADPTIRAPSGKSTIDMVKQWSCKSCAELLEQAIAARSSVPSRSQ